MQDTFVSARARYDSEPALSKVSLGLAQASAGPHVDQPMRLLVQQWWGSQCSTLQSQPTRGPPYQSFRIMLPRYGQFPANCSRGFRWGLLNLHISHVGSLATITPRPEILKGRSSKRQNTTPFIPGSLCSPNTNEGRLVLGFGTSCSEVQGSEAWVFCARAFRVQRMEAGGRALDPRN